MLRTFIMAFQRVRAVALTVIYSAIAVASIHFAYLVRFDFDIPSEVEVEKIRVLWLVIPIKLLTLVLARQLGSLVTFFGISDFIRLCLALLASAGLLIIPRFTAYTQFSPPRGVLLIDFLVCLAAFCSFRLGARLFRERVMMGQKMPSRRLEKVAIIGAGDTGASLVSNLINMPARGFRPVAFLDDDATKHRQFVHGIEVVGKPEEFAALPCLEGVRHVIIAMPSAPPKRVGEIALFLGRLGVQVETVPALEDLASGRARLGGIRPIEIQDLLGRPVVDLDTASIRQFIENKAVMVTGAGGSIGSELCRQIAALNPRRLLLVERSEPALFQIEQELNASGFAHVILPLMADIRDLTRMEGLFEVHTPQIIFHAAAHKHVYLMERQPAEAVKNNAIGTRQLAEIAVNYRAEAFILISTDKAINPTNVMGASKRLAELQLQALHTSCTARADATDVPEPAAPRRPAEIDRVMGAHAPRERMECPLIAVERNEGAQTKLMAVRFGNVLGSSGSVVPIFKRQIESGGPVTVTHPEVTRYFMTIPEASGLVLQASVLGQGGEIFVLDMGEPVKIVDLARNMIELSGYKVDEDIKITFTGLKAGEKLYEEIQHCSEEHQPTSHARIMRFVSGADSSHASRMAIEELEPFLDRLSANDIKRGLKLVIPEYEPFLD